MIIIYILDYTKSEIIIYSAINNEYIDRKKYSFNVDNLVPTNKGMILEYAYYGKNMAKNGCPRIVMCDENLNKLKDELFINDDFCPLKSLDSFSNDENEILYTTNGMDYVVIFNKEDLSIKQKINFDFGVKKIPNEQRGNIDYYNKDEYNYIRNIYINPKYLIGTISGIETFVFDRKTKKIYRNFKVEFDEKNKPIIPKGKIVEDFVNPPKAVFNNNVVDIMPGYIYSQMMQGGLFKPFPYDIDKFLLSDPDNYVIRIIHLK